MMFDEWYKRVYEAGYNARCLEEHEDQNRRLEQMLNIGKKLGHDEGWKDGYLNGYEVGYSEGELDTKDRMGIVEISKEELDELTKESEAEE